MTYFSYIFKYFEKLNNPVKLYLVNAMSSIRYTNILKNFMLYSLNNFYNFTLTWSKIASSLNSKCNVSTSSVRLLCSSNENKIKILKSIKLCSNADLILNNQTDNINSLVVLVGWLAAKDKNLDKYVKLWHNRDFDVLLVRMRWCDLTRPLSTLLPDARTITTALDETRMIYPNILFHTFSSGCYFYASVIDLIRNNPELYLNIIPNLKGTIFDSFLDWDRSMESKARLLINNPYLSSKLAKLIAFYYWITKSRTLNHFISAHEIISTNPYNIPGLLLFSYSDPFTNPKENFLLVENWKQKGIFSMAKCWQDAPHVQNYRLYPQEYEHLIDDFMQNIDLVASNHIK